jgi:hypothetical protein
MINGDWNAAYREELRAFPNGKFKDQVDASSRAFHGLGRRFTGSRLSSPARCSTRSGRQSHRGCRGEMLLRSTTAFEPGGAIVIISAYFGDSLLLRKGPRCGCKVVVRRLSVVFRARYSVWDEVTSFPFRRCLRSFRRWGGSTYVRNANRKR